MTTVTREPFAVAMATFLQLVPWVVFGIPGGVLIDRVDRRRLTIVVDLARGAVLLALAITAATGTVNLPILLGSLFLLGTAEMLADNAGSALIATNVPKEQSGVANSRLADPDSSSPSSWIGFRQSERVTSPIRSTT